MVHDDDPGEPPYIPIDTDDRPPADTRTVPPEIGRLIAKLARDYPAWAAEDIYSMLRSRNIQISLDQVTTLLRTSRAQPAEPWPGSTFSAEH
jgi:hypothetical protein